MGLRLKKKRSYFGGIACPFSLENASVRTAVKRFRTSFIVN
jgi:hypothetical protein